MAILSAIFLAKWLCELKRQAEHSNPAYFLMRRLLQKRHLQFDLLQEFFSSAMFL